MVGTVVIVAGGVVAGIWAVAVGGIVAGGITVSRLGSGWQAAKQTYTNNKSLFKCYVYP
jgi:hypothetical protein